MLCGVFTVSRTEARVDSMRVITGKTNLWLDASMKDVNLLGGIELQNLKSAPVELSLRARPIDLGELSRSSRPWSLPRGARRSRYRPPARSATSRSGSSISSFGSSALFLKGTVTNLHDPQQLALNVKVTESTVVGTDVEALLPGIDLPDLSALGTSTLNLEYEGTPLDFRTQFLLETAAGKVQSSGLRLTVGGPSKLGYDGTLLFRSLNLGRVLADDRLKSNLNGSVVVKGKGVTLRGLASTMDLAVDTSSFLGLPLTETRVALQGAGGRLGGRMNVSLGDMQARLSGDMQQAPGRDPAFHLEGDVSSVNLESILHDTSFNSDITMKLNAQGSGHSLATLGGDVTADLSSSRFRDYTLDQGAVHLTLDQSDSTHKNLQVESNIADLDADRRVRHQVPRQPSPVRSGKLEKRDRRQDRAHQPPAGRRDRPPGSRRNHPTASGGAAPTRCPLRPPREGSRAALGGRGEHELRRDGAFQRGDPWRVEQPVAVGGRRHG